MENNYHVTIRSYDQVVMLVRAELSVSPRRLQVVTPSGAELSASPRRIAVAATTLYRVGRIKIHGGEDLPKPTFANLPDDKRLKVEQAAIREFTAYSYDQASINRIVEAAEIPKGSFYQYFKDKKDLYRYLLDMIVERKMEFLTPVMANPMEMEFFTLLREIYVSGLRFAASNPDLQQISQRLLADRNHPVFVEFMQDNVGKADDVFAQLIQLGMQRGELREDLDVAFTAHILSTMNTSVADFYQSYIKKTMDEDYLNMVDKMLDFLRRGIGK